MKIKLTVNFKNGKKMSVIKKLSDPPKGTDIDTHYMLEAYDIVDKIQQNGLCLSIPPTQIENIFVQPKGEKKDGSSRGFAQGGSVVSGAGLQSASQS